MQLDVWHFVLAVIGMLGGALASYWGAMTAVRVQLAKLETELAAMRENVRESRDRADLAHERIDRVFAPRHRAPDSTR